MTSVTSELLIDLIAAGFDCGLPLVAGRIFGVACFGLSILATMTLLLLRAVSTGVAVISAGHNKLHASLELLV